MNRKEQWTMLAKLMDQGMTEDEAVEAVEKTQGTQMTDSPLNDLIARAYAYTALPTSSAKGNTMKRFIFKVWLGATDWDIVEANADMYWKAWKQLADYGRIHAVTEVKLLKVEIIQGETK